MSGIPKPEQFWKHVARGAPDECWPWTGYINRKRGGYGQCGRGRRWFRSHRVAYELTYGTLASGLLIRHTCHNPPCCNPRHLIPGTHKDNSADCIKAGRFAYGPSMSHARLTPDAVRELRGMVARGVSQRRIAKCLGVTSGCVQACVDGETWAWVK